ncbi:MAG: MFS transporter [Nocardiopsaceae bacterium]|nr:MFS transporter [Nocardiopsaceae bacterium]
MPSPHHPAGHLREGRHRRPPDPRARYGTLFRNREFRWLSAAQALSFLGDQFAQVAIALLVYDRTGSPLLTAVAYALTYLPPIAGGPLLSWLADVFPRRRVMVACDLIRMATVGLMAFRGMPFWALCALLICTVLLGAPFFSARAALMPDILPGNQLGLGSAVGNMLHQSTQILGFVAGAAVVAALGSYRTLALDALSFGVSAIVVLAGVRPRPAPQRADTARGDIARADAMEAGTARAARMRSSTARHAPGAHARQRAARGGAADGIRLVFGNRLLRTLMLFGWLAGFYVMPEGLAAPYAHALGGDAVTVGLLMASVPAGTALGAALVGRLARPSTQLWTMGWLAIMSCAPLVASICDPPLWAVLSLWVLAGVGGSFQVIAIPAFARILTPAERGRAFGVAQSGLYAVQGIGILAGGAIADVLGAPTAVGLSGVAGMLAAAGLAMNWTRLRRRVIADLRSS